MNNQKEIEAQARHLLATHRATPKLEETIESLEEKQASGNKDVKKVYNQMKQECYDILNYKK